MSSTKRYGIWNITTKRFVFNIDEPSKTRAIRELQRRIGKNAHKQQYTVRVIPPNWKNPPNTLYAKYNKKGRKHK